MQRINRLLTPLVLLLSISSMGFASNHSEKYRDNDDYKCKHRYEHCEKKRKHKECKHKERKCEKHERYEDRD